MHELFAMMLPAEDRRPALVMGGVAVARSTGSIPSRWAATAAPRAPRAGRRGRGRLDDPRLLLAVVVPGLYYLFRFRDIPSVARRYAATVTGIVYAGYLRPTSPSSSSSIATTAATPC